MQINTLFNVGELVWVVDNNKVRQKKITFIEWDTINGIRYHVYTGDDRDAKESFKEQNCFSTKEELIKSL